MPGSATGVGGTKVVGLIGHKPACDHGAGQFAQFWVPDSSLSSD
jgi:hypothetical protein